MDKYLLRLIVGIVFMSMCLPVFSQVKLFDSETTKFYEDGTRITYYKMENFPNSAEMCDFVKRSVLENPDIKRFFIINNGTEFMYEAVQRVEPNMVIDAINDALEEYKAEFGDFPPSDPSSTEKPKSNVTVTPQKSYTQVSQSAGSVNQKFVSVDKSSGNGTGLQLDATPVEDTRKATAVENGDSDLKRLETVSPTKYNTNSKNR